MNPSSLIEPVLQLTREVGDSLLQQRRSISRDQIEVKGQGDFVSRADRSAEEMLRAGLTGMLGESVVMGEEGSPEERGGQWRWIVDPLDGTANYLMGFPIWAVSVALEDRRDDPDGFGPRQLGVVHLPAVGITWHAVRGGGAFRNGEPIRVQQEAEISRISLATGFPFRVREKHLDHYLELFTRLYVQIGDMRRAGAAAGDLGWVAEGTFGGYFEMDLKPWDLAAGCLIIEEAGGIATDWWGDDPLGTGWIACGSPRGYELIRREIDALDFTPPVHRFR